MGAREAILHRLESAPNRGGHIATQLDSAEIFRDLPSNADLQQSFLTHLAALKGEVVVVPELEAAAAYLLGIFQRDGVRSVVSDESALVRALQDISADLKPTLRPVSQISSNANFAEYQVGLTSCDALIARTGSVVIQSQRSGGRRLSVLPEIHIVIAGASQLVPSLHSWLLSIDQQREGSYAVIISGPSRTSDIEKTLVLGAHGPKRLLVVIITDR